MTDSNDEIKATLQVSRDRFLPRIRDDLATLYEIYNRLKILAEAIGDAKLIKLSDDLLAIWNEITDTATIKVFANGFIKMLDEQAARDAQKGNEPKS